MSFSDKIKNQQIIKLLKECVTCEDEEKAELLEIEARIIMLTYQPDVVTSLRWVTTDFDMLQEAFIRAVETIKEKIFRNEEDERTISSLGYWIKTVTYGNLRNLLKKERSYNITSIDASIEGSLLDKNMSIQKQMEYEEASNYLRDLLPQILTPFEQEVFCCRTDDELTHKEIAEQLNTSENTSKVTYYTARKKVKKYINRIDPDFLKNYRVF